MKLNRFLLLALPVLTAAAIISTYPLESMESAKTATQQPPSETTEISDEEKKKIFDLTLSYLNKDSLDYFAHFFLSDVPGAEKPIIKYEPTPDISDTKIYRSIPNNNMGTIIIKPGVYDVPTDQVIDEKRVYEKLEMDEIPIDYKIYMPTDTVIQGVYVRAYGGGSIGFSPATEPLDALEKKLLDDGIAVIKLGLIDKIIMPSSQRMMSKRLHQMVHFSIDCFYKIITQKSNEMVSKNDIPDEIMEILNGKKIVLYGISFGGRTSLRHAELYPGTFDGYISHDGGILDFNYLQEFQSPYAESIRDKIEPEKIGDWMDAGNKNAIKNIQDPILILQNFDDNNVGFNNAIIWRERAVQLGKKIQFLPTIRGGTGEGIGSNAMHRGHAIPTNKDEFQAYADTISTFIINGPSKLDSMSQWTAEKYQAYANAYLNKHYNELPLQDKFISWAWRLYNARPDEAYARKVAAIYPEEKNIPEKAQDLITRKFHKSWEMFDNKEITNGTIYDALAYLDKNKDINLKSLEQDAINKDSVRNMSKYLIPLFLDFLEENTRGHEDITRALNMRNELINYALNDDFFQARIDNILKYFPLNPLTEKYLLRILFIANPSLLDGFRIENSEDVTYQAEKQEALKAFDAFVQKQTKEYPKRAWKETIGQVRGQVREQVGRENLRSAMKKIRGEQKQMSETQGAVEGK